MPTNQRQCPTVVFHRRVLSRAGFSMIEMVMVMAIIGVVAAIAVPRYASAQSRYRAQASAKRVAADLELARERARSIGGPVTITFTTGTSAYRSTYTQSGQGVKELTDLSTDPFVAVVTAASFGGGDSVRFGPYGTPNAAGSVTVQSAGTYCLVSVGADGAVTISSPVQTMTRVKVDPNEVVEADVKVIK